MPSSHPPSTMRSAKRIWPHRQRTRLSARFFRSCDMLFTKCSQNGAQIERTKGFDPIQRARHARAFCCQTFLRLSSPLSRNVVREGVVLRTRFGVSDRGISEGHRTISVSFGWRRFVRFADCRNSQAVSSDGSTGQEGLQSLPHGSWQLPLHA